MSKISIGGYSLVPAQILNIEAGYRPPFWLFVVTAAMWVATLLAYQRPAFLWPLAPLTGFLAVLTSCFTAYEIILTLYRREHVRVHMTGGRVVSLPCLSVEHRETTVQTLERIVARSRGMDQVESINLKPRPSS